MLKIDFGSGYNPLEEYKSCDITESPMLDFYYDYENDKIIELCDSSVDEFYLRNVIHHIPDLKKTFSCLSKYLKDDGILKIIDVRSEYYLQNKILDVLWYRYIIPRYEIWISYKYRDYFSLLKELGYKELEYYIEEEKEISIWKKL